MSPARLPCITGWLIQSDESRGARRLLPEGACAHAHGFTPLKAEEGWVLCLDLERGLRLGKMAERVKLWAARPDDAGIRMVQAENRLPSIRCPLTSKRAWGHPPPDKQINAIFFKGKRFRTGDFKARKWKHRHKRFGKRSRIPASMLRKPQWWRRACVCCAATALVRGEDYMSVPNEDKWPTFWVTAWVASGGSEIETRTICQQCLSSEDWTWGQARAKQGPDLRATSSLFSVCLNVRLIVWNFWGTPRLSVDSLAFGCWRKLLTLLIAQVFCFVFFF